MKSPSRCFSNFQEFTTGCPRKLWNLKVAKTPQAPSWHASIGTFYHAVLADLFAPEEKKLGTLQAVLAECQKRESWFQQLDDDQLVIQAGTLMRRLLASGLLAGLKPRTAESWARDLNPAAKYVTRLDLLSDTTPLLDWDGRIVGWEAEPCVIDWKVIFSKDGRSRSSMKSAQLAMECIDAGVTRGMFVEIPYEAKFPLNLISGRFSPSELRQWDETFQRTFAEMEALGVEEDAFELSPTSNPLCSSKWCQFWQTCPGGAKRPRMGAFD